MWGQTPGNFAEQQLPLLLSRWTGASREVRQAVESMRGQFFPGVPVTALMGMTAFVSHPEDQTIAEGQFHAIGLFQTLAGPTEGPAPNPNPNALGNAWGRLSTDARVVRALNRPAVMQPDAWKTHLSDQVAVGLADYRQNLNDVDDLIPLELGGATESQWGFALALLGYGLGAVRAKDIVTKYAAVLRTASEATRFGVLCQAAASDPTCPAWIAERIVHAWQVLMAGAALAVNQVYAHDYPFFVMSSTWTAQQSLQIQDQLTQKANQSLLSSQAGQTIGTTPARAPSSSSANVALFLGALAVAGGAWWYYEKKK